jgi:hypothetical protein
MKKRTSLRTLSVAAIFVTAIVGWSQGAGQEFQGASIEQFLTQAKITSLKRIPEGVTLPQKASLELNGVKQFAVWKTIDEGPMPVKTMSRGPELQFQDSWRTEVAAYELDKLIGLGMVPATIQRSRDGEAGSLQFWVDSAFDDGQRLKKNLEPPDPIEWARQRAKVHLWDNLIYNTDRNAGNLLITSDWKIRLIDHSRTFRPFEALQDPASLIIFSRSLLAKLQDLNEPMLKQHLGKYLSPFQIQSIIKRRDAILALSRKVVEEKGAAAVLYE